MHYIDGQWVDRGSHRFSSENPATGEVIWEGFAAGEAEVSEAVAAARRAFEPWAALPYAARLDYLTRFTAVLEQKKEELARLISEETGKILWDSRSEAAATIAKLTYASEAHDERAGEKSKQTQVGRAVVRHRPHGVVAVYGPYNFPSHLPNGHIQPALLAGNTVVLKPSELTPAVSEWILRQWEAVELPRGVINLIQGEKDTGIALSKSNINGLLFTGSSATGKKLHAQFSGRPEIILALEMGGNNALIIYDVSNIKAAVHETIISAFTGTGQRCTCARRLIIADWKLSDYFIESLIESTKSLKIGSYKDTPEPFMGPLISNNEAEKIIAAQETLVKLGGKILVPCRKINIDRPFITPGIVDVTKVKNKPDEEYFGPLLQVIWCNSMDEAIKEANNTQYGLSASIFSDDKAIFDRYAPKIRAGLVNFNRQTTGASGAGPFGGIGCSGNHRSAGYYAADYCAYPVASVEIDQLTLPATLPPGMVL
jgi:succinylglutamic semialdehyde dehydrogenase